MKVGQSKLVHNKHNRSQQEVSIENVDEEDEEEEEGFYENPQFENKKETERNVQEKKNIMIHVNNRDFQLPDISTKSGGPTSVLGSVANHQKYNHKELTSKVIFDQDLDETLSK